MAIFVADSYDAMFSYESVIHGYHIYKDIWTLRILSCCDPVNRYNHFAAAISRTDVIVGHMPRAVSRIFFF